MISSWLSNLYASTIYLLLATLLQRNNLQRWCLAVVVVVMVGAFMDVEISMEDKEAVVSMALVPVRLSTARFFTARVIPPLLASGATMIFQLCRLICGL